MRTGGFSGCELFTDIRSAVAETRQEDRTLCANDQFNLSAEFPVHVEQ